MSNVAQERLDFVEHWTQFERSLVATRLLAVIQDDLSKDKYGMVNRPTVLDVVQVLNAPAEVLNARREFFACVMTGTELPATVAE
jgi:hypothetical protein